MSSLLRCSVVLISVLVLRGLWRSAALASSQRFHRPEACATVQHGSRCEEEEDERLLAYTSLAWLAPRWLVAPPAHTFCSHLVVDVLVHWVASQHSHGPHDVPAVEVCVRALGGKRGQEEEGGGVKMERVGRKSFTLNPAWPSPASLTHPTSLQAHLELCHGLLQQHHPGISVGVCKEGPASLLGARDEVIHLDLRADGRRRRGSRGRGEGRMSRR